MNTKNVLVTCAIILLFALCPVSGNFEGQTGNITYTLHQAANPTQDQFDAYERIRTAMDSSLGYYNYFTTLTKHLNVHYDTNVQTADANFNGTIRFGSNRSFMVVPTAMHEIAHTIGVGTTAQWRDLIQNGVFTGAHATAMLREITGDPEAVLNGDNQHFWPYGLNYAHEAGSEQDLIDHCRIVDAIFKDLFNEEFYGVFRLFSLSSSNCMVRSGDSLILDNCTDSSSLVRMISLGEDIYRLEFGDLVLDIPGESTAAGAVAGLWGWNGGNHQRAVFEAQQHSADSVFRIRMHHSGHYLRAEEERVIQDQSSSSSPTQLWQLVPADSEPPTSVQRTARPDKDFTDRNYKMPIFEGKDVLVSIIDFRGRLVKRVTIERELNVSDLNLSAGFYLLRLSGEDRVVTRRIFIP